MEFVWNESEAEQIRAEMEKEMRETVTFLRETAQQFIQEANDLKKEADALKAQAQALAALPPIMKTITITDSRRNSNGEYMDYTRTMRVVDDEAMAARQAQIEAILKSAEILEANASQLEISVNQLNEAANELDAMITSTNELFRSMFTQTRSLDNFCAAQMLETQKQIQAYTTRMQGIMDSFDIMFSSVSGGISSQSDGSLLLAHLLSGGTMGSFIDFNRLTSIMVNPNNMLPSPNSVSHMLGADIYAILRIHTQKRRNNVAKCEIISIFSADSVEIS